jgi:hypothetical protein
MIGVFVEPSERDSAREFFELLKTSWEFYRTGNRYDVLICTSWRESLVSADVTLIFSGKRTHFDAAYKTEMHFREGGASLSYGSHRIPVYSAVATFPGSTTDLVHESLAKEPVIYARRVDSRTSVRVGYNLFEEILYLLTVGQPAENAGMATLELHIALLRDLITRSGIPLVEIPPIPHCYNLIACLTHDVDHPVLRNHWFDMTMFGFAYRSTIGSVVELFRGRKTLRNLIRNFASVVLLPFVYLRIVRDLWAGFDRYLEIEAGLGATYFVIPEKDNPGRCIDGPAPKLRASRYEPEELRMQLARITAAHSEVGLHGLDAWRDRDSGVRERKRIADLTGTLEMGVRMHWLYFDSNSATILDAAGFSYDSSVGYNDTVGFRAGTTQVYKPIGSVNLMELPLHIMDTALFYPGYLNLTTKSAGETMAGIVKTVAAFGGVLTINWHDRSIAAERCWEQVYRDLIGTLKENGAWFPTGSEAVAWFNKRRSAVIESKHTGIDAINVCCRAETLDQLPSLRVRIHRPGIPTADEPLSISPSPGFTDAPLDGKAAQTFSI